MLNAFIQWLKALFRWTSVMLMIPLLALAILLTPMGLKIGLVILSRSLPGELHYQRVTGTLLGPLTVKQLSYRYQDQQFSINRLYLQWHPSALLVGKIAIDKITIEDIQINTPTAPSATPTLSFAALKHTLQNIRPQLTAFSLPVPVEMNQAYIHHLTWQQRPGEPTLQAASIQVDKLHMARDKLTMKVQAQLQKPYAIEMAWSVEGAPQQYRFELNAFNPQTNWVISGQVNPDEIRLHADKALIFGGELNLHLQWKWATPMSWELALSGKHLDFSTLQPDWPHPLDLTLSTTGALGENHPHFSWNATVETAQTHVATQGKYDQKWDIYWNVQAHQLAELLPFSSGAMNSSGELHGSLTQPQTKGQLQASLLRWQDYRIDKLSANWDIDTAQARNSLFQVVAEQLFTRWAQVQKVQLSGKGKWNQHELNASIHAYETDLTFALRGGLNADQWQGSLQKLTVSSPSVGTWKLNQPTTLSLSPKQASMATLCLQSADQAQICGLGKWSDADDAWQIALTSRLNLQQLAMLAPPGLTVNLPLNLQLTAQGAGNTIRQAQLTGSTPGGDIRYNGSDTVHLHVDHGQLSGQLDQNAASINLNIYLADNNAISAALTMPRINTTALFPKNQAIAGKFAIDLNNLAPIEALIPDIINLRGKFAAHFSIGGTVGEPLVNGQATLTGGEVKIPGLNIQLNQLQLALNAKGPMVDYTVSATSANQPLRIVGRTALNAKNFPTDITLTGDTVLLADTTLYTIYVTPKIHVALQGPNINITGSVDIPKAVLHQLEFQQEATLPEGEVVFIGEHPVVKAAPWKTNMALTINLGKDVKIDSPGLKGKLTGSMTLLSQPGQVMLGNGQIDIHDGAYEVYGRQLSIAPGSSIIYRRNPLTNPTLSIQAITRVVVTDILSQQQLGTNEITVGMNIGGTSSSPQVTLFSSAGNLSQADMLSFLLLGTSSAGISPTNMNLLLQALNALPLTKKGGSSVEGLTNQVKQGLGLTELGVESEPTFGPTGEVIPSTTPTSYFVVGKRITSRIYFRYKYDPFDSVNLFQLNYLFSTHWSLQLETDGSNQSGADVLYTIQTGTSKAADKTTSEH